MSIKNSKSSRNYLYLFAAIILLLLVSGISAPVILNRIKTSWEKTVIDKNEFVVSSISNAIDKRMNSVMAAGKEYKQRLISSKSFSEKVLFELISVKKYEDISVQLYDVSGNLIAWNNEPSLSTSEISFAKQHLAQIFFSGEKLITNLSFADTLSLGSNTYLLITNLPFEKHYQLADEQNSLNNIVDSLSHALSTRIVINYSPSVQFSKDGRKYSFDILNNFKNKIAVATFDRPSLDSDLRNAQNIISEVQSLLVVLFFILVGINRLNFFISIHLRSVKFILLSIYLLILRTLIFYFEIPSSFLNGSITNPANFSSMFAFGMVRSPLEFTISALFLLVIVLFGYKYLLDYFESNDTAKKKNYFISVTILLVSSFLYLMLLRGLGASIRSVVFDSTIRYFKAFSLFPPAHVLLMNFNILIIGFGTLILSVMLLIVIFMQFSDYRLHQKKFLLISVFTFIQIAAFIFDKIQDEPQGTPIIRFVFISFSFALTCVILFGNRRRFITFLYYAFAASIVSVSLLTYYNSQLEKESLKNTAHELTRTNAQVIQFIVLQTLSQAQNDNKVINSLSELSDLSAEAFIFWTNSLFYREGIQSAINFFDENKKYVGGFRTAEKFPYNSTRRYLEQTGDSLKLFSEANLYGDGITFTGITPITNDEKLIGYLSVSAVFDEDYFSYAGLPKFLTSQRAGISSVVDFSKLKVFDFHDGELIRSYGSVTLSQEEQKEILNASYSQLNDAWLQLSLNDEDNVIYAYKIDSPVRKKVLAVALEEKNFSWRLSDFFKVFLIHTMIIVFLVILFLIAKFKKIKLILASYRTRLVGAFLVVSLVPLFLIAIYFRNLTEEKNSELIEKRLTETAQQLKLYLNLYNLDTTVNQEIIFEKATKDLGIGYSLYRGKNLIYSTHQIYNSIGILPVVINPYIYNQCVIGKNQRVFLKENIENRFVNSVYLRAEINGNEIFIYVNDLLNTITIPLSDVELDIFLFGIFSLAVILIVLFSTILASQISSPIRKLTSAAKSVGSGDLNVEVTHNSKGEIKEMVDGFNMMVRKIKQSQTELALLERETAWKEMAKQVAHEIKNPLTPMKLSVQQLVAAYADKSSKFDAIFGKVTTTIISQIEILKNIASEFSNFARMPRLNIEKINIVSSINEALNLFDHEKIKISVKHDAEELFVNADDDNLKRTIVNLVRNSIQAEADNISFIISSDSDFCLIRISDDGRGIAAENTEKVFDENFTTKESGMGLGLSMGKKFIESIGGTISVERTTNEGTIFLITIPIAK